MHTAAYGKTPNRKRWNHYFLCSNKESVHTHAQSQGTKRWAENLQLLAGVRRSERNCPKTNSEPPEPDKAGRCHSSQRSKDFISIIRRMFGTTTEKGIERRKIHILARANGVSSFVGAGVTGGGWWWNLFSFFSCFLCAPLCCENRDLNILHMLKFPRIGTGTDAAEGRWARVSSSLSFATVRQGRVKREREQRGRRQEVGFRSVPLSGRTCGRFTGDGKIFPWPDPIAHRGFGRRFRRVFWHNVQLHTADKNRNDECVWDRRLWWRKRHAMPERGSVDGCRG